ncbi:MAG: LacI family DNA-binding transcriptional regulator [Providencia rettgeri]|uniref:LacI family DNA-binding transcriptional regulator n=1 Tax=unclassified Providencia TaxID=2633465 RepID=UPI00234ABAE5|nr:LacI family DNA-binding transcriptional regulator [Providencia sp. PROV164]
MSTLKDVARHAGVSVTTVSNFINNNKKVSDETRRRLINAIQSTGYIHNSLAASLKKNATGLKTVGIITIVDQNPFFSELFFNIENECFKNGIAVISCFKREDKEDLKAYIDLLIGRVDGIIIISLSKNKIDDLIKCIHVIPIIALAFDINEVKSICGGTGFNLNNELGGYIGGRFLLTKGHQNLVCLTGPKNLKATRERIAGLKKSITEFNISDININFIEGDYTYQSGINAMYKIFSYNKMPTAIICHNDLMAIGVQNAANELGIKSPRNLSIIGYDNIEFSKYSFPSLTTIKIPLDEIAYQAVDGLKLKYNKSAGKIIITVNPSLVVRNSVDEPNEI